MKMNRGAFCQFAFRWIYYYGSQRKKKLAKRTSVSMISMAQLHTQKTVLSSSTLLIKPDKNLMSLQ